MHQYEEKRLQEQQEVRDLVEQVIEGHKNAKEAKIKLQKYKQEIGTCILPEKWEMMTNVPKLLHLSFSGPFLFEGKMQDIHSHECMIMNSRNKLVMGRSEILSYCFFKRTNVLQLFFLPSENSVCEWLLFVKSTYEAQILVIHISKRGFA